MLVKRRVLLRSAAAGAVAIGGSALLTACDGGYTAPAPTAAATKAAETPAPATAAPTTAAATAIATAAATAKAAETPAPTTAPTTAAPTTAAATPAPTTAAATTAPEKPAANTVTLQGSRFDPANLTVKKGATVEWVNKDEFRHTVTADAGAFESGDMEAGDEFEFAFDEAGVFLYYCRFHGGKAGAGMAGTITVE